MASVREIAKAAGVSITTVSRALNNDPAVKPETRDRILAVANRTRYVLASARKLDTKIGFAFTQEVTPAHPFDSAVLEGVARGLDEFRFDVVLISVQRDKLADESYTRFFMRKGVRGVILRTTSETRDVCQAIANENFPHVVISERFSDSNVNFVDCNSNADSARAVEYLIALGHRRIAFGMHAIPDRDHLDRFEGYKRALANHEIPFDEKLVFQHRCNLAGGATVMDMIMSMSNRPTAVYFADPLLAVGAVKKAHELDIQIPEDISVVGFDDSETRFGVYPTLTAVCQDASTLGVEASRWLARALSGTERGPFQRTIPPFFEINHSTGAPPQDVTRSAKKYNGSGHVVRRSRVVGEDTAEALLDQQGDEA